MAKRPRVHWTIPTTIALAFVAGLLFATGHHVFYASLGGTPVDDGIFDQQQNLAIGNAFAFLVRPVLVISIGATYWQIFWPTLLNKSFPLETADALAALLSSIIDILSPKAWLASPLLVFIAAIAWLIPFATIVPPATLTVRLRLRGQTGYRLMHMQSPNFLGVSMGENIAYWNDDNEDSYNSNTYYGTTNYLARAVTGTALDGQLPKLPSPAINASYILSYPAPSLQCEKMPTSVLSSWAPAMGCDPTLQFDNSAKNFFRLFLRPVWRLLVAILGMGTRSGSWPCPLRQQFSLENRRPSAQ